MANRVMETCLVTLVATLVYIYKLQLLWMRFIQSYFRASYPLKGSMMTIKELLFDVFPSVVRYGVGQEGRDSIVSSSLALIAVKTFVKSKVFSKPVNDTFISFTFSFSHIFALCLSLSLFFFSHQQGVWSLSLFSVKFDMLNLYFNLCMLFPVW